MSMQLKDFVSETINQIVEGIVAAQKFGQAHGALVNPKGLETGKNEYFDEATGEAASLVEFDVAVTAAVDKAKQGGIGIFIGGLQLGAQRQSGTSDSAVNRVKFSVPVHLPKVKALKKQQKAKSFIVSV